MIWYALLIPPILSIIAYVIWHKFFIWQELLLPLGICLVFIIGSYFTLKEVSMHDIEYNGYVITEARYYEYYETWVQKTCSYTTTCCCDSKGNGCTTTTHYYDCSYCDENPTHYEAVDNFGHKFDITFNKYMQLVSKWSAVQKFVELNRRISYHGGCGKDGDMYFVTWNNKPETSECSVLEKSFRNPVKVSHSAFQYPVIEEEVALKMGLYNYPEFYETYKQKSILGLEAFKTIGKSKRDSIQTLFEFINGNLGPKNKVKVFTLIFKNKPIDIAFKQEAYWSGGNQNEIVVCISLDDDLNIQWVKPFSWCDNKRIIVDTREDVAELNKFDSKAIYEIYNNNIPKYFHYKSFKDFNYLKFEPTTGQLLFVYIGTFLITIGCLIWCIKNDIKPES